MSKDKFVEFLKNNRIKILISITVLGILLCLILVKVFYPEVRILSKKFDIDIQIDKRFSSSSEYPFINADQRFKVTTNSQKFYSKFNNESKQWQLELSTNMLEEGENSLNVVFVFDALLFELVSSESNVTKLVVDRIAPDLRVSIINPKPMYVLEDIDLAVESEIGSKIEINTNEYEFVGTKTEQIVSGTVDNEISKRDIIILTQKISTSPLSGTNKIKIKSTDSFGNYKEVETTEVRAFSEAGYSRKVCRNMVFPLSDNLQFGPSGVKLNDSILDSTFGAGYTQSLVRSRQEASFICNDEKLNITIQKKGSMDQCYHCGAMPTTIDIKSIEGGYPNKIINTTKAGIGGYWTQVVNSPDVGDYSGIELKFRYYNFLDKNTNKWYQLLITPFGNEFNKEEAANLILDNLYFE